MLKLYDLCAADKDLRFSPYCWRIKAALKSKNLDFETIPVSFTAIPDIPLNPSKRVPVLVHGDETVCDSFNIATYLDNHWPDRSSLFDGKGGLHAARFIEAWAASSLHPHILRSIVADIHNAIGSEDQPYFRESREKRFDMPLEEVQEERPAHLAKLHQNLLVLDMMLREQPFIGGETPNFSDFIVYGSLKWPTMISDADIFPEKPRIRSWFEVIDGD